MPGIDWDGLEELKVKSWPTSGQRVAVKRGRKNAKNPALSVRVPPEGGLGGTGFLVYSIIF